MFYLYNLTTSPSNYDSKILGAKVQNALKNSLLIRHNNQTIAFAQKCITKSNQIFHYTRCNSPKRVTRLRGLYPHHCTWATQLHSKKCCSGGKPLATLCQIWPAQDLNLRPPASATNTLPLDQLAGALPNWSTVHYQIIENSNKYFLPFHLSVSTNCNTLWLSFLMTHCFFRLVSRDVSILPPNAWSKSPRARGDFDHSYKTAVLSK